MARMTDKEFDEAQFGYGDYVEIRKYFGKETQEVEFVNFSKRTVNGYCTEEIIKHIKPTYNEQ